MAIFETSIENFSKTAVILKKFNLYIFFEEICHQLSK